MGRGNDILFVYCHSERSEESPGRVAYRGVYIAVNCSNIKSVGFAFPGDVSLTLNMTRYSCLPYRESIFSGFCLRFNRIVKRNRLRVDVRDYASHLFRREQQRGDGNVYREIDKYYRIGC